MYLLRVPLFSFIVVLIKHVGLFEDQRLLKFGFVFDKALGFAMK